MASSKPTGITVRTYNVGFGDCFLIGFHYGKRDARHVLIDFGSKRLPEGASRTHMKKIASQIKKDCGGKLQVVVATHRHQDHISGFATNKTATAPGDVIASCKPEIVIQPWTEDPDLDKDAIEPELKAHTYLRSALREMQNFAAYVDAMLPDYDSLRSPQLRELKFKGSNGIKNESAVVNLMQMGKRAAYVKSGDQVDLSEELPGVNVRILGPPSLSEAGKLSYASDSSEYWFSVRNAWAAVTSGQKQLKASSATDIPIEARWFVGAADDVNREEMLGLVRILDNYLNNTSVILLFEAAGKKLLFPGDAQLENWNCALKKASVLRELGQVDLYKVGHHGSRNATPKKLWCSFKKKGDSSSTDRLRTLLSTMTGVYHEEFEVPREALVEELKSKSTLYDSENIQGLRDKEPVRV